MSEVRRHRRFDQGTPTRSDPIEGSLTCVSQANASYRRFGNGGGVTWRRRCIEGSVERDDGYSEGGTWWYKKKYIKIIRNVRCDLYDGQHEWVCMMRYDLIARQGAVDTRVVGGWQLNIDTRRHHLLHIARITSYVLSRFTIIIWYLRDRHYHYIYSIVFIIWSRWNILHNRDTNHQ